MHIHMYDYNTYIHTCIYICMCVTGTAPAESVSPSQPARSRHLDTLQRGVQWEGGAVDWGSIML